MEVVMKMRKRERGSRKVISGDTVTFGRNRHCMWRLPAAVVSAGILLPEWASQDDWDAIWWTLEHYRRSAWNSQDRVSLGASRTPEGLKRTLPFSDWYGPEEGSKVEGIPIIDGE
ncbi:hypothetical protein R1flu_015432 [Riccia fluitans]|uniref:Uncharacterized protein n=1 Tax=Riccia fluitans TaxID=41844 RepID=A0ABD1YIZ0_9MARC